jgi:hypothetical protein
MFKSPLSTLRLGGIRTDEMQYNIIIFVHFFKIDQRYDFCAWFYKIITLTPRSAFQAPPESGLQGPAGVELEPAVVDRLTAKCGGQVL